jgi:hypothetical protein
MSLKDQNALTPLEALIVETFKARGGVFALDEDGDLHAVIGGRRAGLYAPTSSAPFLLFYQTSMARVEFQVTLHALKKGAALAKDAGEVRRIRVHRMRVEPEPGAVATDDFDTLPEAQR